MPSYPLTFPTNVYPASVRVRRRTAAGVAESPFTYTQQVYQFSGVRWEIDVTLPTVPLSMAGPWTQFFYDLQGRVGFFAFNLDPHCPGLTPAPGVKNFRLTDPDPGWDSGYSVEFGFSFRATEVL